MLAVRRGVRRDSDGRMSWIKSPFETFRERVCEDLKEIVEKQSFSLSCILLCRFCRAYYFGSDKNEMKRNGLSVNYVGTAYPVSNFSGFPITLEKLIGIFN